MDSPDATKAGSDAGPAFVMPESVEDGAALWLIRHGQTEWSRDGKHTGRTDIALTERGEDEARALAPILQPLRPALVLCSPRQRARRTAELAGLHIDAIDDDLAEWDYGDYEGLTSAEIQRDVPGWTIFSDGARNGEQAEDVRQRADRVLTRAAQALPTRPGRPRRARPHQPRARRTLDRIAGARRERTSCSPRPRRVCLVPRRAFR